jgi:hypothetical protein
MMMAYRKDLDLIVHIKDVAYDACDEDITKVEYSCTQCGAEILPYGYDIGSHIKPYFKIKDKHKPNCDLKSGGYPVITHLVLD